MTSFTLRIPETTAALLKTEAEKQGLTPSAVTREALKAYLTGSRVVRVHNSPNKSKD